MRRRTGGDGPSGSRARLRSVEEVLRRWMVSAIRELRRTRRVIVAPESRLSCESPVFICGVHRSGTTLLRLVLDSHSNLACPPESFFIAPLSGMADDEKAVEGLTAMGFDEAHVRQQLRDLVAYFFEVYAASRGKKRWADKTPPYVDCLDFIESLFGPRCQYLVMFRHGLDVSCSIASMRIREVDRHVEECNGDRFAGAARYWAIQCEKLLEFQARYPERCLELRYEVLTRQPEQTLRRVFEFLDEPWEPAVLRFYDRPHDHWIGLQDARAAESTGFLQRTGLWKQQSPEVVERMLAEAGLMLERLGYRTSPDAEAPP